jgi:hypothetical protein
MKVDNPLQISLLGYIIYSVIKFVLTNYTDKTYLYQRTTQSSSDKLLVYIDLRRN